MGFEVVQVVNPRPKVISEVVINQHRPDATNALYQTIDVSKYRTKEFFLVNLTDSDLIVHVRYSGENKGHMLFNGSNWFNNDEITIPGGTQAIYCLNTVFPYLNEVVTDKIGIRLQTKKTVANNGVINLTLKGEQL